MRSAITDYIAHRRGFFDVGRRLSLLDCGIFASVCTPGGEPATDSLICSTTVQGTSLQSVAITDAQSDAALDTRSRERLT